MQTKDNIEGKAVDLGRVTNLIELQAAAMEATANAVVITDLAGKVIWVNSAFEQMTGFTRMEIVGGSTRLLKSGLNSSGLYEGMWRTILQGKVWRGELVNRRKDGSLYDEEMTITPVHDRGGEISHFIAVKLDITERRKTEAHLHLLTERLSLATAVAKMGVWELELASSSFTWDGTMFEIVGYPPVDRVPYETWSAAVHPEDLPSAEATLQKVVKEKVRGSVEIRIISGDGSIKNLLVVGKAVLDVNAKVNRVIGTAQDITERKRFETNLRRLAAIVESSDEAIISKSLDGIIYSWNSGAERTYGYSAVEAIGMPISFLNPLGHVDEMPALLEKVGRGESVKNLECARLRKDGKEIRIILTISPLRDDLGGIVGVSSIARDITEHRNMEEMFRQAQKMEAVGRLAGGVAHDFNNMMSVIIGYSDVLLDRADTDDRGRQQIEEIKRAGERAAALTRQLLAFSRQQVLEPKVLNLNDCVTGIEKMLRHMIGEDIELETSLDPTLGSVKVDVGQIEQVIVNLAVNARDAMPNGGRLVIETSNAYLDRDYMDCHTPCVKGSYVLLAVTDSGIGMTPEIKGRIFEPFFTTKEVGIGTGLGLATVFGVIKQSGGFIWVYSEPGQGTAFKIYLPRIDVSARLDQADFAPQRLLKGTETILLVEDEQSVRRLAYSLLVPSGYTVLEADNGTHAVDVAVKHAGPIHVLLTDLVMPGISGPQLAEQILKVHPEAKTLFMSGYSGGFGAHAGLVPPGTTLLQKPFSKAALSQKLREVLDNLKPPATT